MTQPRPIRQLLLAAILAGAAAAAVLALALQSSSTPLGRLANAIPGGRPFKGRLSGNLPHRPYQARPVGAPQPGLPAAPEPSRDFLSARAEVYADQAEHKTPRARADLGVVKLFEGEPGSGASVLALAAREAPGDASIQCDLAVAYLERAEAGGDLLSVVEALDAANTAAASDPSLSAAYFNRALALQQLGLDTSALRAWDRYLSLDASSPYADEARAHRSRVAVPAVPDRDEIHARLVAAVAAGDIRAIREAVEAHPDVAHAYFRDELFREWADLELAHDARGSEELRRCRVAAEAFAESTSDRTYIAAVESLERRPGGDLTLAAAHRDFCIGRQLFEKQAMPEARERFLAAHAGMSGRGAPAQEAFALLFAASCDLNELRYEAALRGLGAVRGLANDHGFAGILGREAWVRGSTLLRTGDLLRSCEAYREAVGHFDAIRDWDSATAVRTLLSKNAANLGDRRPLDENSARALSESGRLANPRRRARVLVEIAETIGARAKPRVALDLLEEGIAANVDDPELRARLRITRGHLLRAVGRLADARLELEAAEPLLGEIPSEALRAHQRSNLLVSRAALALSGDPSDALAPLDEACAFFERAEHRYYTITARVMRARARRALGDLDGAEDDLRAAIAVDERNASQLAGRYSPSVFDRPQDAYDEMTELLAESRGRPNAAFAVAEMARARALSADLRAAAAPPDLDAVRAGLPVGVVMLAYAALDDRLYVWAVSRTGADWRVVPEPVESLAARARALSVEQEADEAQTPHQTELLYDLLVRPVETRLAGCESVVVVASDPLVDVPFAILFDGARKRYLVEACAITVAPSAGVYLACLERDAAFGGRTPHSALVIGDPAFDPASFPSLPRLPAANAEARNVAALYTGNVEILTAAEATERRVVERAPAFGVLHFAGHGLLDAQLPDLSALLLAPEAGGDGRLCAYEFAKLRLPKTRVAVLAACRTGVVPEGAVDAVSALSRALLLSGVPTVVVSWRDVDDRATAVFSAALHTALRNGAPPDQAVRSGQLALLNDPDPRLRAPKMWGAFGLVGGARGAATP